MSSLSALTASLCSRDFLLSEIGLFSEEDMVTALSGTLLYFVLPSEPLGFEFSTDQCYFIKAGCRNKSSLQG